MSRRNDFRRRLVLTLLTAAVACATQVAFAVDPANPSFSGAVDQNTLTYTFPGTYRVGGPGATLNFSVFNFAAPTASDMIFASSVPLGDPDALLNFELQTASYGTVPGGGQGPMSLVLSTVKPSPAHGLTSAFFTLKFRSEDISGQPYTTDLAITAYATILRRGDYDSDGDVDNADYGIWRSTLGNTGPSLAADGNQNNAVDAADYAIWRNDYTGPMGAGGGDGNSLQPSALAAPEPSSLAMLLFTAALAGLVRRRPPPVNRQSH